MGIIYWFLLYKPLIIFIEGRIILFLYHSTLEKIPFLKPFHYNIYSKFIISRSACLAPPTIPRALFSCGSTEQMFAIPLFPFNYLDQKSGLKSVSGIGQQMSHMHIQKSKFVNVKNF